ncbi:MAG TPA: tape measure protein [Devosia sp.]|nr:tape measure protein [Devosia sp.]
MTSLVRVNIGAHEDAAEVMGRLADIARSTYSSLELTAQGFAQNAFTLNALGKSTKQQLDYTSALNNALVVSGAKGQQAQMVQDSLNRAMAEGTLRGQELQNVLNYGSTVATLLAEELGVNVTQLRDVAKEGRITGEVIFNALVKNMEQLEETAESMPATIGDGFLLLRNSVLQAVGVFDQANGISEGFAENLVAVADAIREIDLDPIIDAAAVLAAVIGARLTAGLIASTAGFVSLQVQAIRTQVALQSVGGASAVTSVRLTAMAATARAASAALALVGGPVGLAVLAAGSLAYFGSKAVSASRDTDLLTRSVEGLTRAQRGVMITEIIGEIDKLEGRAATAARNLAETNARIEANMGRVPEWLMSRWRAGAQQIQADSDTISQKLDELRQRWQTLANLNIPAPKLSDRSGIDGESDAFKKLNTQLRERLLLVGLNTEADRLAARVREGYIEGLKEGEGEILVALQRQIDAAERAAEAGKSAADEAKRRQDALKSSFESTLEGYQRQIALGEDASEVEQLLYEIQYGRLQGLLPAQQEMLRGMAEELDMRNKLAQIEADQQEINRDRDAIARELMSEEERIQESYARRRAIIENATFENEQARTELLLRLENERNEALIEANGSYWDRWLLAAEENLSSFDELSKTVVDSFTQQFGNAFEDMIFNAESVGDAVQGMAQGMVRAVVNAIGQMIAQELAYQAIVALRGPVATAAAATEVAAISTTTAAAVSATATTTATQTAAAATTAAAWTPAAFMASIGSFGAAAAIGIAAVLALGALGGFRKGGYTGNGGVDDVAGVVHGKEFVFDAAATSRIGVSNLEAMRKGQALPTNVIPFPTATPAAQGGAPIINVYEAEGTTASVTTSKDDQGRDVIEIVVNNLLTGGEIADSVNRITGTQFQGS